MLARVVNETTGVTMGGEELERVPAESLRLGEPRTRARSSENKGSQQNWGGDTEGHSEEPWRMRVCMYVLEEDSN